MKSPALILPVRDPGAIEPPTGDAEASHEGRILALVDDLAILAADLWFEGRLDDENDAPEPA
jgi:hypothetical protein